VKRILKFPLQIVDEQKITVTYGATPLAAQFQDGTLCLWILCNTDGMKSKRTITIVGTGHLIAGDLERWGQFVATVQKPPFVWHVFIGPEERLIGECGCHE
jgi:hypothetical protein